MTEQIPDDWRRGIETALEAEGAEILPDQPHTILATLIRSDELEGHFRVDHEADGSWRVFDRTNRDGAVVSRSVELAPLIAFVVEQWRLVRHRYMIDQGMIASPFVPGFVRAIPLGQLAERLVAVAFDGRLAATPNHPGFDVQLPDGRRVQVKSSIRNVKNNVVSTVKFLTDPAYFNHDIFIYVEFSEDSYPVRALRVESEELRRAFDHDHKNHQVWPWMVHNGDDISAKIQVAFDRIFISTS